MRILCTHNKRNHPYWLSRVDLVPGWQADVDRHFVTFRAAGSSPIGRDLKWAWRVFRASRKYDVLLTGSERLALIVALLQRFVRRNRRVPHVLLECMWTLPEGCFARWKRRRLLRWVADATDRIIVYARHQREAYARTFGIPKEKFVFVPSHSTLYGAVYDTLDGGYIFSGGYTNRDYRILLDAIRGLPYNVVLCLRSKQALGSDIPSNVTVTENVSENEFNRLMASATIVVLPLKGGAIEAGGRQVFQNAMSMGKPVIVTDMLATDYIVNGVTGLLSPAGDPMKLREAIVSLITDPARAYKIGEAARMSAADFSPERFFDRVFAVIEDAATRSTAGCGAGGEQLKPPTVH